ncbi:MAG: 16S rRNA (uracil(1498)-N(3))-methyltransferase [Holosporales bacterium]|nr:16S rRNA (uracil(1498)-N(3))-methyltransferase [Holosporales bacterium]
MKHVPRIYCEPLGNEIFELSQENSARLAVVLRLKEGSVFKAFNKIDGEWRCLVVSIRKKIIYAKREELLDSYKPSRIVALAFCPIKQDRLKIMIEKCTELGVTSFYPIQSEYTNAPMNLQKMQWIAIGATEQSERLDIPTFHDVLSFDNFVEHRPKEFVWISAVERKIQASHISELTLNEEPCGFIIGPEGGFSDHEKKTLAEKTTIVTLSKNILRTETAAIVCISHTLRNSN